MTCRRRSWSWWRWSLTGLSALGLALSGYLGWHYLEGGPVIGCGGGSPCDEVLNSRWSAVAGVWPVSGLAAGVFLAMLTAGFFIGPATETSVRRLAWRAMLIMSGAAAGSAVWFIIVQHSIVGSFCPYCMATHITSLLLAALVLWQAPKQFGNDSISVTLMNPISVKENFPAASRHLIGSLPAIGLVSAGLILACILALCQIEITSPAVYRGGESKASLPLINPHDAPLVGSPDAPYVVNLLFDYNCPHCQELHFMLDAAIRHYDGKVAFALCPTPLNSHCNPYIPQDVDEFKTSCDLAKIALAVWVARRDAFSVFDRWMFSYESGDHWQPRTVDAARAKAIALVGQSNFNSALKGPRIEQYLQTCVRIYGATIQGANDPRRANAVPKLVFGSHWVIPQADNAKDLISILHDSLGVPEP